MADLTKQSASLGGSVIEFVAAADPAEFPNTGSEVLLVRNAGGSPVTATITSTRPGPTDEVQTRVISIAADSKPVAIGPFPAAFFNGSTGKVSVALSAVQDVTVALIGL